MMSRSLFALPLALLAVTTAACSSTNTATSDGGTTEDTGKVDTGHVTHDAGHHDGGVKDSGHKGDTGNMGFDASDALPPGPVPAAGSTKLVSGTTEIIGLTDDGYLIYVGGTAGDIYALPYQASGTPTPTLILAGSADASATNGPLIGLIHNIVWVLTNYNANSVGTVSVWSHAHPTLSPVSNASLGLLDAAADSSAIVYTTGANAAGKIGSIEGANADGTSPATLIMNADINNATGTTCPPLAAFDQGFVVVQSCTIGDGGLTGPTTLTSFNAKSAWASVVLQNNALTTTSFGHFVVDDAGINALTFQQILVDGGPATEQLSIVPLATGAANAVTLTANGGAPPSTQIGGGVPTIYLNGGSTSALFSVFNNGLSQATFANPAVPAPVFTPIDVAVDGGSGANSIGGLEAVSPDGKWAVTFGSLVDTQLQLPTTMYLQSLVESGGAFPAFQSLSTGAAVYVLGFSADGTYLLYSTNATSNGIEAPEPSAGYVGTLYTVPLVANATPVKINVGLTVWDATGTHGTTLIYNWNYEPYAISGGATGSGINGSAYADIWTADAKTAATGTVLVASADANYYLSQDKTKLIYSFTHGESTDGVYIVNAP
jgi:hypothetical protein